MRYALILIAACGAIGQTAPTLKVGDVTVSGSLRIRAYGWDWFQSTSGDNSYGFNANILRVNFAEKRNGWEWDAEFAAPFLLALPDNASAPAPQGAMGFGANYYTANGNSQYSGMVFLKQGFVRFHGLGASEAHSLQIGRFEFSDGMELAPKDATLAVLKRDHVPQRLIGTFGFTDVGRSFDGLRYSYTKGANDFTFVAATPTRGVFQTDGWGWNRIGFGYAAYTHEWGHGTHVADTRLFVLDYDDWRHILKTDNRPAGMRAGDAGNIRVETFGGHSAHVFKTQHATYDALAWAAVQTGRWGVQTQRAYAFDVEGGFQPKLANNRLARWKPWIRGGYTKGSGDDNPNDTTHGTFFQVLPTPRPYARFPFFNMMNTEDGYGALVLRPGPKITVSSEFHTLRLSNAKDLWYIGGGAFQPWTFGYTGRNTSGKRSLGNLYDTSIEYRASRPLILTGYFGYGQGLASMEQIYPRGKGARMGYLEAMIRF